MIPPVVDLSWLRARPEVVLVTACHNLIGLEHAGLGRGRLYPGSWSQYSGTERPVATGE